MLEFFSNIFNNSAGLAVFFVSMIPTIEGKVGIPFGMASQIWGDKALSACVSACYAFLGSILPTILMILLGKFLKKKTHLMVVERWTAKFKQKNDAKLSRLKQNKSAFKKCFLLASFVAVPLPLTGVYAGGLIAGLSDLKFWQGLLSVVTGEIVACVIVALFCACFENASLYIFIFALSVCVLYLLISLISSLVKHNKKNRTIELGSQQED